MALVLRSNVYSDVYITGNCVIGGTVTSLANPVNSLMTILQDQKTNGSNGGGATGGAWNTRTLNTSVIDQIGVSLGSNQFTLPAGTYYVEISTPACQVNNHRCRLYNVTTSSTVLLGTSECAQNANPSNMSNRSFIDSYFTSVASGVYRIDHWCNTSFATQGLGMNATSGDVEIFTTVKIIKINSGAALNQRTTGGTAVYYNSGNVGIGTTNPLNQFTVFNSSTSVSNVASGTASTAAYSAFVNTADSRRTFVGIDGTGLFALSTGALALGTDNTPVIFAPNYPTGEKMRITPGGNVGIGTSSPVSLLTVQGEARITGNLISAGFTSNATNTVFNSDTLTVPFVSATQVLASTLGTAITGTALQVSGNLYATDTIASANPMMFRNRLINGDMRINQRGATSLSITQSAAAVQYLFDRWGAITNQVTGYFTASVQTLTTSDTPYQYGFRNSMRVTATTGAALPNYIYPFYQGIEGNNITDLNWGSSYGAPVTVSFWFRSNMAAGSTGSFSVRNSLAGSVWALYNTTFTVVGGGAWQYVVLTIPAPANGTTWNTGTAQGIEFLPCAYNSPVSASGWVASAQTGSSSQTTWWTTTGNYIEITGVQLEKGLTASPYEFRPIGTELALCQRYFQIINCTGGQNFFVGLCGGINGYTCSIVTFKLTTAMRVTPTSYWYSDFTPQLVTVAGGTSAINYIGNTTTSATAVPGLAPSSAAYGIDSATNTTIISLLPCASGLASPGTNVPLFVRSVHIDFSAEY